MLRVPTSRASAGNTQTQLTYLVANVHKLGHQLARKRAILKLLSWHRLCASEHVITILGHIPARAVLSSLGWNKSISASNLP
jgi:hypothetical protein